jgi:hypothetical protein
MTLIAKLIPEPGLVEVDHVELAAPPARVWQHLRHGNLGQAALIRALFALRTLPSRTRGERSDFVFCIDELGSTPDKPGFQVLGDDPERAVTVGAIGKVWQLDIPFVHVADAAAFAAFAARDHVKVAWEIRLSPLGERDTRLDFELRVAATDERAWRRFRHYFRIIGPGSHFIRASILADLERRHGTPAEREARGPLPGDELIADAGGELTHAVTLPAPPEVVWPWLLQMGCRRGGFYSYDALDNGGARSAREVHPELLDLAVGDVVPARPDGAGGFEVLRLEPARVLVLGGLFDAGEGAQRPFAAPRPERFWQATWAFVLEPRGASETRLVVRARAAFSRDQRLHAAWMRAAHHLMQRAQLRHLRARVAGELPRDDWHDVLEGAGGAGRMLLALVSPWSRPRRARWGLDEAVAGRPYPGDELVAEPSWGWTHGVEIAAPPAEVWPWLEQLGAGRGGFYSYQWLENLAGCDLRNAETLHPEWEHRAGDALVLHPKAPPIPVTEVEPGRYFIAHAPREAGTSWVTVSWLFLVEPRSPGRSRFISRFRSDCSDDLATRLAYGPLFVEPVGFVMDRRMLEGVKDRAERRRRGA